jgi:ribose transport system substrate-binding protein
MRSRLCSTTLALCALLLVAALLLGCGKPPASGPTGTPAPAGPAGAKGPAAGKAPASGQYTIALVMKAASNPFFETMRKGAEKAASELGVKLLPQTITDESSDEQQTNIVNAMVVQKVQAILIAPANSKSLVAPLLEAQKAGILVVNVDNRLDADTMSKAGLEPLAYVGADNQEGGKLAGQRLCELLGGKGKVAMLEGRRGVDNAEARKQGFEAACKENPGIEIVDSQSANWDLAEAQNKFGGMLAAHPDIQGLFCANDNMAMGAIAALGEKGLSDKVIVVSYDNIEAARKAVREGKLAATIEQHPDRMGYEAVKTAVAALKGEKTEPEILVPLEVIDKAKLGG